MIQRPSYHDGAAEMKMGSRGGKSGIRDPFPLTLSVIPILDFEFVADFDAQISDFPPPGTYSPPIDSG